MTNQLATSLLVLCMFTGCGLESMDQGDSGIPVDVPAPVTSEFADQYYQVISHDWTRGDPGSCPTELTFIEEFYFNGDLERFDALGLSEPLLGWWVPTSDTTVEVYELELARWEQAIADNFKVTIRPDRTSPDWLIQWKHGQTFCELQFAVQHAVQL